MERERSAPARNTLGRCASHAVWAEAGAGVEKRARITPAQPGKVVREIPAHGRISWTREHGWSRIVKAAHRDLDWHYGILGAGGKAFWRKAGFRVAGTFFRPAWEFDEQDKILVQARMAQKGMTEQDLWTWRRMAYEL